MNRRLQALGVALAAVALVVGGAAAGHLTTDVKSYTGCVSKDGAIIKVKEGAAPSSPCSGGTTQIHFSGGDITSITVGDGLTGGGTNGAVSIGLDASFTLPQDCVAGEIVERTASGWACGDDDDTTYAAGTGLDLSAGNVFSVESDNLVVNGESCSTGQLVTGIDSSGHITCAAPPAAAPVAAYSATGGFVFLGGTMDILTLNVPAGNYLAFADVEFIQRDADTASDGSCTIGNGKMTVRLAEGANAEHSGSVSGAVVHPGGPLVLRCTEEGPDVDIVRSNFHAIRVSSLN